MARVEIRTLQALALVTLAGGAVACGPSRASAPPTATPTSITAADVPATTPREAVLEASSPAPPPAGQLVCRTKSLVDGTTELYLEWNGDVAKGALHRVAPSGMVYDQRVQAERGRGLVIVDEPGNMDLVTHLAIIAPQNGKQHIRLGDAQQPWSVCE